MWAGYGTETGSIVMAGQLDIHNGLDIGVEAYEIHLTQREITMIEIILSSIMLQHKPVLDI